MDKKTKQKIIELNKQFGLNTEFVTNGCVLGYALNNTIYINESIEQDYERTNKHELLHFFEETEEFQKLKKQVLEEHKDSLEQIENEYSLRYFGLYSEDEIKAGVLENEIVIDLLIDNSVIKYEKGLQISDSFLGNIVKNIEQKRYLNMTLNNNIKNMNLTKWEKLFVVNYYDGKEKQIPKGKNRLEEIRNDITLNLKKLYEMDELDFLINPNSPEIIRKYENRIKSLKQKGEDTSELESYKEISLKKLANNSSKQLWGEYKHIVDFIQNEDYEPAFKYLMLNETLTKTYKKDDDGEKNKTIVNKRDLTKSIAGHMILNKTTLDVIYNNLENYQNFANMYFAALEIFNKVIANKNVVALENVETFGKGKWLKFEGKELNEEEYLKNTEKLASLVKDTPWCTKSLASRQLAEEDFFVFIDNEEKPHIAITISEKEIDEVRGIQNGSAQELEEEYRDVALSFLEKIKDIPNGKDWIEKEEWNKRLIEYNRKIELGELTKEDTSNLIEDLFFVKDYKSHDGRDNSNKEKLRKNLYKIKGILAEHFKCAEEEICAEDFDFSSTNNLVCPYTVILGNVYSGYSDADLNKLQIIGGDAVFTNSLIKNLPNLQMILGDASFCRSQLMSLEKLKIVGGKANFSKTQITNLENLQTIGEDADFEYSQITNLENLQSIGGNAYFKNSQVLNLKNLRTIGGTANFKNSQVTNLENLQTIGRHADFRDSKVTDLSSLQSIGGISDFRNSEVVDLKNLRTIGSSAYFYDSQVTNLDNLQSIGRDAFFTNSKVASLENLENIGGKAYWNNREDLEHQYEETSKRKKDELLKIAKKQRKDEFVKFVNQITDFTLDNRDSEINQEGRGENI